MLKCCSFVHGRELWATATLLLAGLGWLHLFLIPSIRGLCASRTECILWPWARQAESGLKLQLQLQLHLLVQLLQLEARSW
ncbi:uncharacterized protein Dana_GF26236 [Drosophila ananassae]|uniref:Uncharacterized protein n=1 Tax=Drosophila ananassae TaxID=7217 RepID=A0A0P8XE98_DROAN|nr:uncharacterized protein Dana_GF26236 [Drosophila ananassae]